MKLRRMILLAFMLCAVFLVTITGDTPQVEAQSANYINYLVRSGDSLTKVAYRHCTTWTEIYNLNRGVIGNNPDRIEAGMILIVPNRCGYPVDPPGGSGGVFDRGPRQYANGTVIGNVYTAAWGDTLWSISQRFGVPVSDLVRVNNISRPNKIDAGQQLIIPGLTLQPPSSSSIKDFAPGECLITPRPNSPSYTYPGGPEAGMFVTSDTYSAIRGSRLGSQYWYMIETEPGTGNPPEWVRGSDLGNASGSCAW